MNQLQELETVFKKYGFDTKQTNNELVITDDGDRVIFYIDNSRLRFIIRGYYTYGEDIQ